jgi:phosphoheptose isomerase
VLGTLTLATSTIGTSTTVSQAIGANVEIGARIVRATGTGSSTFNDIVVNITLEE